MKKHVFILFLSLISMSISAQKEKKKEVVDNSKNVASVGAVVNTFYQEISGKKGEKRNWTLFKFLFHPNAKLITAGKNDEREFQVQFMGAGDYIKSSEKWMVSNGFIENEISRKSEIFGKMAHVFSTFEAFNTKADTKPIVRGIYSFQLLHDGDRWWIINLYWTNENWMYPIPDMYLN